MVFNPVPKPTKQEKKPKRSISPVSEKRKEDVELYIFLAKKFKEENKKCAVCRVNDTTDVHHSAGRQGYYDEWAKWMDVPLLLDIRFFVPLCRTCHQGVEQNPEWALKNGYSIKRTNTK